MEMKCIKDLFGGKGSCSEDPQDFQSWYNKGVELMGKGSSEEAIKSFDQALKLNAKDVRSWNNKGICLLSLSRFEKALDCLSRAVSLDPKQAFYWYNKGICEQRLGKADAAISSYDRAIEILPKYAEAWFNKAAALEAGNDRQGAAEAWRSYIKVAGGNKRQQEGIAIAVERLTQLEQK
jgi:tetratricopeptide (TPR) repeat protein